MKLDKISYINFADIGSLTKKIERCENNRWRKIGEHIPCGYSVLTIWSHRKQKYLLCHSKDCIKKLCEPLREHTKNITDFEKEKNVAVTKRRTKITSICKSMLYYKNLSYYST